jgi:phosphoribosylamine---glycine ligase
MLTETGPKVLEFNCRFGDPEAQVILPLLDGDPLEIMLACVEGRLDQVSVSWQKKAHVGVVMTSGGYPAKYETEFEITGLDSDDQNSLVFHAGTRLTHNGGSSRVVTSGGRVLTVVGWGNSLDEARIRAYDRAREISFHQAYYRTDIGVLRVGRWEKSWVSDSATRASYRCWNHINKQ